MCPMCSAREHNCLDVPCLAEVEDSYAADAKPVQEAQRTSGCGDSSAPFLLPTSTLLARGEWVREPGEDLEPPVFFLPSALERHCNRASPRGRSFSERRKHRSRCSSSASAPDPCTELLASPLRSRTSTQSRTLSSRSSDTSASASSAEETSCAPHERRPLDAVGDGLRRCRRERRMATAPGWRQSPGGRLTGLDELLSFSLWEMSGAGLCGTQTWVTDDQQESALTASESLCRPRRGTLLGRRTYSGYRRRSCNGRGRSSSAGKTDSLRPPVADSHAATHSVGDSRGSVVQRSPQGQIEASLSPRSQTEAFPDDVEHAATLLNSPSMFKHVCKEQSVRFGFNKDGAIETEEANSIF